MLANLEVQLKIPLSMSPVSPVFHTAVCSVGGLSCLLPSSGWISYLPMYSGKNRGTSLSVGM